MVSEHPDVSHATVVCFDERWRVKWARGRQTKLDSVVERAIPLLVAMASAAGSRLAYGPLDSAILTFGAHHLAFAPLDPGRGTVVVIAPSSVMPGLVLSHLRRCVTNVPTD